MNMNETMSAVQVLSVFFGLVTAGIGFVLLQFVFRSLTLAVEDETEVLIMRFGRLNRIVNEPGLHFLPEKMLPWTQTISVSKQLDFRHYRNIHVNDMRGTTMILELWMEFRIEDTVRALYHVEDWEKSLQSSLTHSASSILGTQLFENVLLKRTALGQAMAQEIASDAQRWGIHVASVFIRKVGLLPEVSQQMFNAVAARLELAKAQIEEDGRLKVARLDAETESTVAELVAEAKGQYPAAIGDAYARMQHDPEVLHAYNELYELGRLKPHRTVAFQGFSATEVSPLDAAMLPLPGGTGGHAVTPSPTLSKGTHRGIENLIHGHGPHTTSGAAPGGPQPAASGPRGDDQIAGDGLFGGRH